MFYMGYVVLFSNLKKKDRSIISVILGFLLSLALPPFNLLPCAFASFAILYLIVNSVTSNKESFFIGWWFGSAFFIANLSWLSFAIFHIVKSWLAVSLILFCIASFLALYTSLALYTFSVFKGENEFFNCLKFSILLTFAEWLRENALLAMPWNLIGYIWSFSDVMIQSASVIGIYGLVFVSVFVGISSGSFFVNKNFNYASYFLSLLILISMYVYGSVRLHRSEISYFPNVNIRLMRPENISAPWKQNYKLKNSHSNDVTHVIWPKSTVDYTNIIFGAHDTPDYILFGNNRYDASEDEFRDSVFVITGNNEFVTFYDKRKLIPFLEYMPKYLAILNDFFVKSTGSMDVKIEKDLSVGKSGIRTIKLHNTPKFSPLISYEVIFSNQVINRLSYPEWMLNLTDDSWLGLKFASYQSLVMGKFRAVEEGISLVRVAKNGFSAVIDPYGRIHKYSSPEDKFAFIDSGLPMPSSQVPLYRSLAIYIDLLIMFLGAIFLTLLISK